MYVQREHRVRVLARLHMKSKPKNIIISLVLLYKITLVLILSVRTDSSGQVYNHQLQIRYRALDLLSDWIDGYYQFDFKTNPGLIEELLAFVKDEVRSHFAFAYFHKFL